MTLGEENFTRSLEISKCAPVSSHGVPVVPGSAGNSSAPLGGPCAGGVGWAELTPTFTYTENTQVGSSQSTRSVPRWAASWGLRRAERTHITFKSALLFLVPLTFLYVSEPWAIHRSVPCLSQSSAVSISHGRRSIEVLRDMDSIFHYVKKLLIFLGLVVIVWYWF